MVEPLDKSEPLNQFEQEWQMAIAALRRWSRIQLMSLWDVRDSRGEHSAWIEEARQIWMWVRDQRQQFTVNWEIPRTLQELPLAGAAIRIKLAWWADWGEIWVNGNLRYEGDLFDRDCRLLLTGDARPGQSFQVEVRLQSPGHDDGALQTSQIEIEYPERACDPGRFADELAVLWICRGDWLGIWDGAAWLGRLHHLLNREVTGEVWQQLAELRQELLPLGQRLKQRRVMLLGNAHIDVAWLWPISETREVVRRTFESVLHLQRQFPRMTFNQSTALSYWWLEEKYPSLLEKVKQAIDRGWWEITGGMWVEPDCNLPIGESLVRQILYGKEYFKGLSDRPIRVAWNPDSFGFCWQLPQILRQSGFEIFITQKLTWNDSNPFPHQVFWWQGLDGSRILTYFSNDIGQGVDPEAIAQYSTLLRDNHELSEVVWLYGVGDHGGGPTADMLNVARSWARDDLFFVLEPGTIDQFLDHLQQSLPFLELPVWDDELYLELHRGTYTTKGDRKRQNRQLEVLLGTVECLRSIAAIEKYLEYPQKPLTDAWQQFLTNQFHDILPGTAIPEVFEDADRADVTVREICQQQVAPLLAEASGERICLWNGLNWERSQLVMLVTEEDVYALRDLQTQAVLPIQQVDGGILFRATVPSLGAACYEQIGRLMDVPVASDIRVDRDLLENALVSVQIDPASGNILQIFDKRTQRPLLSAPATLQCFEDRGQYWDAWNIDPDYDSNPLPEFKLISREVVETGPLRGSVRIVRLFRQSTIVQTLRLEAGNPQLFVHTQLDWQDTHTLLKAAFPLSFTAPTATYEIPFGAIARSTMRATAMEAAKWEVPALRWADMAAESMGLAVLNDCKYGYDAQPGCLRITLLKSPTWPHPTSDLGLHEFTYCVLPHEGDWRMAGVVRRGYELNHPLVALSGKWIGAGAVLEVDADNIVMAAFKRSQDGLAWILRLYEAHGLSVKATVRLKWAIAAVQRCNLLEHGQEFLPFENSRFSCHFSSFEIKTYRIQFI
ncbi:MAG: alpha-mannosidase [Synechococcus sp.]